MELSDILYVNGREFQSQRRIGTPLICIHSRIVNLAVATITILGGIAGIFLLQLQSIILGAYLIVFGLAIALL
ncbi:hypothetical protein E4U41_002294, partial [Claviceps citrina]